MNASVKLCLCGDVMIGRGIDQALPYPCDRILYEPFVTDARVYVNLAEKRNGPIKIPLSLSHIWGDCLSELDFQKPDATIINLETSITTSRDYWRNKGINYRVSPENARCLLAAKITCCTLSNNHVLDWGYSGLTETLLSLQNMRISTAGAGQNKELASRPAILRVSPEIRVLVYSIGLESSGIPISWAASSERAGVYLFNDTTIEELERSIMTYRRPKDLVIISLHWGSNWGYQVFSDQIELAHTLIDCLGANIVFGHSSHHPRALEVYHNALILYGCGDFINDYEGIRGHEDYRGDLSIMYFVTLGPTMGVREVILTPFQIRHFQLNKISQDDFEWLYATLNEHYEPFRVSACRSQNQRLTLAW